MCHYSDINNNALFERIAALTMFFLILKSYLVSITQDGKV